MFATIVHQTLEDRENVDYVEQHGPFAVQDIQSSYLGSGYYFWDDHIELAKWWGEFRIKKKFIICEGDLQVKKEVFFDLVGCRQDMIYFKDVIKRLKIGNLGIGAIIELLKGLEKRPDKKGIFPFKVIRAIDTRKDSTYIGETAKFAEKRRGILDFNPQIMICMVEKNKVILPLYKVIYPESYKE